MSHCRVFVGLDYHQASVQVCVVDGSGAVMVNRRCDNDWRAIVKTVPDGFPLVRPLSRARVRRTWRRN